MASLLSTSVLPIISVVVPTKNEERNLGNCLKSIKQQTYPQEKIEIIVVDNNSTDKTQEVAKKYTRKVFNFPDLLDLAKVKNLRGAQLNFGVKQSRGEIIFFPDADMTCERKLIEEAVTLVLKSKLDALYVPEVVVGRGILGKIRNFERSFYNTTCIDAVRLVRKNLFLKVGGFDEANIGFGPDDWDFTKRIKKITQGLGITRHKIYHHEEELNLWDYLSKKKSYTNTFSGYINKWGKNDPDIKKQLGFCYRYFGVFLEGGKWKRLLKHPTLAGGIYFLRLLVGSIYLYQKFLQNGTTR